MGIKEIAANEVSKFLKSDGDTMTNTGKNPTSFHWHVCGNCFTVNGHMPLSPEPCNHHDCKKCGEEIEREAIMTRYEAEQERIRMKQAKEST